MRKVLIPDDVLQAIPNACDQEVGGEGMQSFAHVLHPSSGSHWWIVGYDPTRKVARAFAVLGGDTQNAEIGDVDLAELEDIGDAISDDVTVFPCALAEAVVSAGFSRSIIPAAPQFTDDASDSEKPDDGILGLETFPIAFCEWMESHLGPFRRAFDDGDVGFDCWDREEPPSWDTILLVMRSPKPVAIGANIATLSISGPRADILGALALLYKKAWWEIARCEADSPDDAIRQLLLKHGTDELMAALKRIAGPGSK